LTSANTAQVNASGFRSADQHVAIADRQERLGRKWMDEQRIDNCNVPIDKAHAAAASACAHVDG